MGLRDKNPLIDSDLELIITSFEKGMTTSRDVDSVLVPFRRELSSFSTFPQSIVNSIDGIPTPSEVQENDERSSTESVQTVTAPEYLSSNPNNISEDGSDDEDWTEKVKNWVSECVPCSGEFKRTISSMNADFFVDIGESWDAALDETLDRLTSLENLLDDADVTAPFCDLGNALKFHCTPDIEKMIFILSMFLNKMEIEIDFSLSIFDSFLTAALSPIFNELAANLDLIDTLALDPIRCVLDQIQYQINNSTQLAQKAKASIIDPVRDRARQQRNHINQILMRERQNNPMLLPNTNIPDAEQVARRARYEEQARLANERVIQQQSQGAIERANQAFEKTKDSIDFLNKFKDYIETGTDFLEEKKKWLLNIIEEFVNTGLDRWNNQMQFANSKVDILTFISIMKAMVDAAKSGDFSCGPESGSLTEGDVARIADYWLHPAESLEILVEDGNIVTRRHPDIQVFDDGIRVGSDEVDSIDAEFKNIVVRRPISSCLKKVTDDEAEQVTRWISQLE
jgi:hypothetical protein